MTPIDSGIVRLKLQLDSTDLISQTKRAARQAGRALQGLGAIYKNQTANLQGAVSSNQQLVTLSKGLGQSERIKLVAQNKSLQLVRQQYKEAQRQAKIEKAVRTQITGSIGDRKKARIELERTARIASQLERAKIDLGFKNAVKDIKAANAQARVLSATIKGMGLAVKGALIGSGVGAALAAFGALANVVRSTVGAPIAAIGAYREYDKVLSQLAVVAQKSREELAPLTDTIKRLGTETSKAPKDVAALALSFSRLGFSTEETGEALEGIIRLNEAGGGVLEETGASIASVISTFGLAASDTTMIADAFVVAANNSGTSVAALGGAFDRVGGSAGAYSQTVKDVSLALGVLANNGFRDVDRASTAYNQVLVQLVAKSKELKDGLGVDVFDVDTGQARQLTDIVSDLERKVGDLSDRDLATVINELIPDKRAQKGLIALLNGLDEADGKTIKLRDELENMDGAAAEAGAKVLDSSSGQLDLLTGKAETFANSFAEKVDPAVKQVFSSMGLVFDELLSNDALFAEIGMKAEEFSTALAENPELVKTIADAMAELISMGLDVAVNQAERLIDFLKDPEAVDSMIDGMTNFVTELNSAVQGMLTLLNAAQDVGAVLRENVGLAGMISNGLSRGLNPIGRAIDGAKSIGSFASGLFTGPQGSIGSGAGYHIDTKLSKDLSTEEQVAIFDQLAAGYAEMGKEIEFSNAAVAGEIYRIDASIEEKMRLIERAAAAHSHSLHAAYDSFDYYIPDAGRGRHDRSAEGAEILLPSIAGGNVEYGSGGNYGNFATITDGSGNVVLKTGHGDNRQAIPANRSLAAAATVDTNAFQLPQDRSSGGSGNLERFFDAMSYLESNNDPRAYNTTDGRELRADESNLYASGAFQFTPITRQDAAELGLQDPGDRSLSYQEQRRRAIEFARVRDPEGVAAAEAGDFDRASALLNKRWTSLPGGAEEQDPERMAAFRRRLGGEFAMRNAEGGGTASANGMDPQVSSFLENARRDEGAEREAEKAQREAERAAEQARREALDAAKEARNAAINLRSEIDETNDMARDAVIAETRAAEDLALESARANNPNSELISAVTDRAEERLSAYRSISDEIEQNNRAARDLNQAIADERSNSDIDESVNNDVIAQYEKQLQQLGRSNELLREQRDKELELLNIKYKQVSEEQKLEAARARAAEVTGLQRQGASLERQLAIASEDNPLKVMELELQEALAEIDANYSDQFMELRNELESLTQESEALQSVLELDPTVEDELSQVNARLEHTSAVLTELGRNRGLEEALAGVDLEKFQELQRTEFLDDLRTRRRDADLTILERDEGPQARRDRERELGSQDILGRSVAQMQQARDIFGAGSPQFNEAAEAIQAIADADLSDLISQTESLSETFARGIGEGSERIFKNLILQTESWGDLFNNLLNNAAEGLLQIGLDALGSSMGGGTGGFAGGIASFIGSLFGTDGHIPGSSIQARNAYDGFIPSYAEGNVGGILSAAIKESERMPAGASLVMANDSEAILNQKQQKALAASVSQTSMGNVSANVSVAVNNYGDGQSSESSGKAMGRDIEKAVISVVTRHTKPGGKLYRGSK